MRSPFEEAYALCDGWSALEVVGADAGRFLQNLCTNDVLALADDQSCEAMFLDAKAHVHAYAWVSRCDSERYLILLPSCRSDRLRSHLDRYLIRERVELKLVPPSVWTVGRGVSSALTAPVPAFGDGVVAALDAAPPSGSEMSHDEFERCRIRLRAPLDGVDVDDRNLPQEVDRNDRAISFTKGCYLGQEPVARIDALGRVNWLLRCLSVDGAPPKAGVEVMLDDKTVGRVTSSVASPEGSLALAYMRREHSEAGTAVRAGAVAARVEAETRPV